MREQQCPGLVLAIRLSTSDCSDDTPNAKNSSQPYTYQSHHHNHRPGMRHHTPLGVTHIEGNTACPSLCAMLPIPHMHVSVCVYLDVGVG
jgi:hypothetical protein